jgi:hypothetical protein
MSFVSVVVGSEFITIVADRRAIEVLPNGEYGRIIDEEAEKIAVPTEKVFYSIVGIVHLALDFIKHSKMVETLINENQRLVSKEKVKAWYESNKSILKGLKFGIVFGGESEDGFLRVFSIDSLKSEFKETTSPIGMINTIVFPSSKLDQGIPLKLFSELYGVSDGSVESTLEIQEKLNDLIADIDGSVNKEKTFHVIRKSK